MGIVCGGITDNTLWPSSRRARDAKIEDNHTTRRGTVQSSGWLACPSVERLDAYVTDSLVLAKNLYEFIYNRRVCGWRNILE